ncbi:two-component system OmpR family sensor kinase [Dongia mobilis]|uniref:histidine kinase n=1 Tax=Dongia mobilis TaxID=578943 RepID=A0A4R6WRD9_9PROT|nr:two-component system OmpR family sensor kinase [Dongia mobilis]
MKPVAQSTRKVSIARRLMLTLGAAVLVLWLMAVGISTAIIADEINEVFDSALQETAQRLLALAENGLEGRETEARSLAIGRDHEDHEEYLIYHLRDRNGQVLLRSHDAPDEPYDIPLVEGFFHSDGRYSYTEASSDRSLYIQVLEQPGHRVEAIVESALGLVLPLGFLLPLAAIASYLIIRQSMRPIHRLRSEIASRGGHDLSVVPVENMPVELMPIVKDINRLLRRLDRTLKAERDFVANSAHELRTPVAAAIAQSQRLAAELGDSPQRVRVDQVIQALRRLAALAEKLLQLARAESGSAASDETVDLLPVIDLVRDEFERQPDKANRIVWRDPPTRLAAPIDIDAFAILLRNLIENAINHGAPGGRIELFVDVAGDLHVVNAGPVVPPAELQRLTDRFARGRQAGAGFGLGLAISAMILRQAGGDLFMRSPAEGRGDGFEAIIRLPAGQG